VCGGRGGREGAGTAVEHMANLMIISLHPIKRMVIAAFMCLYNVIFCLFFSRNKTIFLSFFLGIFTILFCLETVWFRTLLVI
jgi:hypothetical protein